MNLKPPDPQWNAPHVSLVYNMDEEIELSFSVNKLILNISINIDFFH